MKISWQKSLYNKKFLINILSACVLSLTLLGCATSSTNTTKTDALSESSKSKALVYGITISIPDEWYISGSGDAGKASNEEIDKAIDSGNMVPVIDMYHPAMTVDNMDARMGIFLTDSTKAFIPQDPASTMSDEDFSQLAKNMIAGDQAQAKKSKTTSNIIDWRVYRTMVAGHMAIIQEGRGKKSSGGEMLTYSADIYLAKGKGLTVKAMCEANQPETLGLIKETVQSITIAESN